MSLINKIPARSTSVLIATLLLSYTFWDVMFFVLLSPIVGVMLFALAMLLRRKFPNAKKALWFKIIVLGDVYLNFTLCPILFNQWYTPKYNNTGFGFLVTDRLAWNKGHSTGYKRKLSIIFCNILNKYDKDHC